MQDETGANKGVMCADEIDRFLLHAMAHASRSLSLYGFAEVHTIIERCRKLNAGNWRNLYPPYTDAYYTNRP